MEGRNKHYVSSTAVSLGECNSKLRDNFVEARRNPNKEYQELETI